MGTEDVVGALHIFAAVLRLGRDAGIDEAAPIIPGPAEEIALVDVGQIVGDEVGAEHVALVDHGPELVAARIISEADRIAQARGEGEGLAGPGPTLRSEERREGKEVVST